MNNFYLEDVACPKCGEYAMIIDDIYESDIYPEENLASAKLFLSCKNCDLTYSANIEYDIAISQIDLQLIPD